MHSHAVWAEPHWRFLFSLTGWYDSPGRIRGRSTDPGCGQCRPFPNSLCASSLGQFRFRWHRIACTQRLHRMLGIPQSREERTRRRDIDSTVDGDRWSLAVYMDIEHRALANLVDAIEVETTHQLGNKLRGGSAGCGSYRAINQGVEALGVELSFTLKIKQTHPLYSYLRIRNCNPSPGIT